MQTILGPRWFNSFEIQRRHKQVANADEFIKLNNWDVKKSQYLNLVDVLTGMAVPVPAKRGQGSVISVEEAWRPSKGCAMSISPNQLVREKEQSLKRRQKSADERVATNNRNRLAGDRDKDEQLVISKTSRRVISR